MRIPVVPSILRTSLTQDTVELRHGQTYRATVVEANEGTVLLRLGGILIEAESEVTLSTGQVLVLRAEQMTDTALALRIVDRSGKPEAPVGQSPLGGVLAKIGMPDTPQNQAAVRVLLQWLQPVRAENVAELTAEARVFSANRQEAYLNVRGWATSTSLQEDRATIHVVTRFLLGSAEPEQVPLAVKHINQAEHALHYPEVSVLWWHSKTQHGEIYVFRDGGLSRGKQDIANTLAIRIQTERLGELWVRFAYLSPELELAFVSPFSETLGVMREKQSVLESLLSSPGLSLQRVYYRQGLPSSFLDIVPPREAEYQGLNLLV